MSHSPRPRAAGINIVERPEQETPGWVAVADGAGGVNPHSDCAAHAARDPYSALLPGWVPALEVDCTDPRSLLRAPHSAHSRRCGATEAIMARWTGVASGVGQLDSARGPGLGHWRVPAPCAKVNR